MSPHAVLFLMLFVVATALEYQSHSHVRRSSLVVNTDGNVVAVAKEAAKPLVVYSIMTNNMDRYKAKLDAQLATWASDLVIEDRVFAVTGKLEKGAGNVSTPPLVVSTCSDAYDGITCKEEMILEIAFNKSADWLMVLGDDNYVSTSRLEEVLSDFTVDEPLVLGIVGCELYASACPEFHDKPSLCGGGGYAINKAALAAFMADGTEKMRASYAGWAGQPTDVATACHVYRHGMHLTDLPGLTGNGVGDTAALQRLVDERPLTYHYLSPEQMRFVHSRELNRSHTQGQTQMASLLRHSPLISSLRLDYIRSRNAELKAQFYRTIT